MRNSSSEALLTLVKQELAKWHAEPWWPIDPEDPEFDREAKSIVKQLGRVASKKDAALCLSRVFASSFCSKKEFSPDACAQAGSSLYQRLVTEGYLTTASNSSHPYMGGEDAA
jgi:hypothetical protein